MISLGWDKKTNRTIRKLEKAEERMQEACKRFAYWAAEVVRENLQAYGRAVEGVKYDDLEIFWLDEDGGYQTFALVLPETERHLEQGEMENTVLYVKPLVEVDDRTEALRRYSPWPAKMLPDLPDQEKVKLIARKVSPQEIEWRTERLLSIRGEIARAGLKLRDKDREVVSRPVQEDVAWRVLRQEFGLADEQSVPHWRVSLRDMQKAGIMDEMLEQTLRFVMGEDDALKKSPEDQCPPDVSRVEWFQKQLGEHGKATDE